MATKETPITKPYLEDEDDDGGSSGSMKGVWLAGGAFVLLAAGAFALFQFKVFGSSDTGLLPPNVETFTVKRGDLVVTITESGGLESARNLELKSQVEGQTSILEIVPDGTQVKKGDQIVLLDASEIESQIESQDITVTSAVQSKLSAEKDFEVAEIGVIEYLEGTFLTEKQTIESNIIIAKENLRSAEDALGHAEKMARKGYITPLQLATEKFSVERAKLELELKERELITLEKFTKAKTLADLESKKVIAKSKAESEKDTYEMQVAKLNKYKGQLDKCKIVAPQDGMVVYAQDQGMRGMQQGPKIEQGAAVKQFQPIIKLPDLSKMQVRALINETKIQMLAVPYDQYVASINIQGKTYTGQVSYVATQPEPDGWFGSTDKKYSTLIRIDGQHEGLKPGMTAEVKILVAEKRGVVWVNPQAVVEQGNKKFYVYVVEGNRPKRRAVDLGVSNDDRIEITKGLDEGEEVLLNPRRWADEANEIEDSGDANADLTARAKAVGDAAKENAGGATSPGAAGEVKADAAPAADATAAPAAETKTDGAPAADAKTEGAPAGEPAAAPKAEGAPQAGGPAAGKGGMGKGGMGKGGGKGKAGGFRMPTFRERDANSDGKITKDELDEQSLQYWDGMDTNADGFIDKKEYKVVEDRVKEMMAKMKAQQGGGGPPQP